MTRANNACNVRNKYLLDAYDMAHVFGHGIPIHFDDWHARFPGCHRRMRPGADPRESAQRRWERFKRWLIDNYPAVVSKRVVRTHCGREEHETVALVLIEGAQAVFARDLPVIDEAEDGDEREECAA